MARLAVVLLFPLLTVPAFAKEAGWLRVCTKRSCYYKPYVVTEPDNFVIFVSPAGRTYIGRCRRKKEKCLATTRKRFSSSADPFTYIELTRDIPPRVVSYGEVSPLSIRKVYR